MSQPWAISGADYYTQEICCGATHESNPQSGRPQSWFVTCPFRANNERADFTFKLHVPKTTMLLGCCQCGLGWSGRKLGSCNVSNWGQVWSMLESPSLESCLIHCHNFFPLIYWSKPIEPFCWVSGFLQLYNQLSVLLFCLHVLSLLNQDDECMLLHQFPCWELTGVLLMKSLDVSNQASIFGNMTLCRSKPN